MGQNTISESPSQDVPAGHAPTRTARCPLQGYPGIPPTTTGADSCPPLPEVPACEDRVQSLPAAFCKDPPRPRQPPRPRLAGAGLPSCACAASLASTTEDAGGDTSGASLREAAGPLLSPSGSRIEESLGHVFWRDTHALWHRPGETCPSKTAGLVPGSAPPSP